MYIRNHFSVMTKTTANKNKVLTPYGYRVSKNDIDCASVIEKLTAKPWNDYATGNAGEADDTSFCVCMETKKHLFVPKYFGLQSYGIPESNLCGDPSPIHVDFRGTLLPEQHEPVSAFLAAAHDPVRMGGILQLPPGAGKTVMGLYIMCQLGVKTMIIVHKEFLQTQWVERINQYVPDARVGLLKQNKAEVENVDITIASLQSLSMRDYSKQASFSDFGLVIIDECHHIGAQVFSKALLKVNFRYALGLSATVNRKDGLTKVFKWFIGDVVFKVAKKKSVSCSVERIVLNSNNSTEYMREHFLKNGKVNLARMINALATYKPRLHYVLSKLKDVLHNTPSRNVIMLSDRRQHLEDIYNAILQANEYEAGLYIGGMKNDDLERSKTKQIILGTYNMVSEGFDLPKLDTLFLLTPKSDVEQSVGRIQRKHTYTEDDNTPLVIDIVDNFSLFRNQANKREAFYNKMKYDTSMEAVHIE